jgi:hypothetical protein
MKRIAMKVYEGTDGQAEIRSAEILRNVVRQPLDRREGITIDEMRKSLRVLDAIDAANGTLELEDADWQLLHDKMVAMTWGVVDKRLVELYDAVTLATDTVPWNDK